MGKTPHDLTPTAAADSAFPPPSNSIPEPTGAGAAKIGILIPVKTLTGESDDPAISWDRTWMLPASEARAIAADSSAKHDWYAVGVAKNTNAEADAEEGTSTGVDEVLTVTKARTAPASTTAEDIDQWIAKTDPEANNLLTKTYESRTARDHQRNAVLIRDGQCQTPGCTEPGWSAEIDHKQSYETGGATTGENLHTL
ncbi:HNH endonuclease, partial [Nesterenkonia sp. MY13]